jgi:hypothetical protein
MNENSSYKTGRQPLLVIFNSLNSKTLPVHNVITHVKSSISLKTDSDLGIHSFKYSACCAFNCNPNKLLLTGGTYSAKVLVATYNPSSNQMSITLAKQKLILG